MRHVQGTARNPATADVAGAQKERQKMKSQIDARETQALKPKFGACLGCKTTYPAMQAIPSLHTLSRSRDAEHIQRPGVHLVPAGFVVQSVQRLLARRQ